MIGTMPAARWWAFALPVACVAGLAATVWLDVVAPAAGPGVDLAGGAGWGYALHGVVLGALASMLLARRVGQRFVWALAWLGVFWTLDGLAQAYVRAGLREDEVWPGMTAVVWFLFRFGAFLPVSLAALLVLFPTGRFLPGRWGTAARASLAVMFASGVLMLVVPSEGHVGHVVLPPAVDLDPTTWQALDPGLQPVAVAVGTAAFVVPMLSVVVRYRRSSGLERERMRWLWWAVQVMAIAVALTFVWDGGGVGLVLTFLVMAVPATAMTIAVLNPEVVPVQDLIVRTTVFGALAGVIMLVDLAAVAVLTRVLDGLDQTQVVAVVLLLSVLLYGPLRLRLWGWARRRVLGARHDPYDVVAGLASTLETADEGPEQLAAVAQAVATAFRVGYVSVEVDRAGGERVQAAYGERPAETRTLPITYRDAEVGRLVLPARGLRSRLTRRDEQLLGDVVRQAATAARTGRLAEELQQSRERLVVAREEERRRIRRDLHDGLGPALSGVVFRLESARLSVDRDPQGAREQIAATSTLVQDVVADVRRLVHDLRPPALDDRGLVGALRQQADQSAVPTEVVTVPADGLGALPAAVEVAAYRIVGEATTNVVRHARASRCCVRLERTERALVVEVADDGVGVPAGVQAGVGLVSLRERAAELGGSTEVTCPPGGGTVVRAVLPLRSTP